MPDKSAPPVEYPIGDILYNWMFLRMNDILLELREYLNTLGLTITKETDVGVDDLMEDITEFLKGQDKNESE